MPKFNKLTNLVKLNAQQKNNNKSLVKSIVQYYLSPTHIICLFSFNKLYWFQNTSKFNLWSVNLLMSVQNITKSLI